MSVVEAARAIDGQVRKKRQDLDQVQKQLEIASRRVRELNGRIEVLLREIGELEVSHRDLGAAVEWKADKDRKEREEREKNEPQPGGSGGPGRGGVIIRDGRQGF
jgi:chromosome segregation ATPase